MKLSKKERQGGRGSISRKTNSPRLVMAAGNGKGASMEKKMVEVDRELMKTIMCYFLDGEFEDDTGAGRDSLIDDCTAAKIYDALLSMRKQSEE